jgi:hypothetical protein
MSLRQRRSDPFRTQSLPRNEREPSEENFISDPRAHKRWQRKDASIRRTSHSRRYNQSYGLSPNHLTEGENVGRLNGDIEVSAKYLNLIASKTAESWTMSGCSERRLTLLKVGQLVDSFRVLFFVLQHWAAALRAMAKRWCIAVS